MRKKRAMKCTTVATDIYIVKNVVNYSLMRHKFSRVAKNISPLFNKNVNYFVKKAHINYSTIYTNFFSDIIYTYIWPFQSNKKVSQKKLIPSMISAAYEPKGTRLRRSHSGNFSPQSAHTVYHVRNCYYCPINKRAYFRENNRPRAHVWCVSPLWPVVLKWDAANKGKLCCGGAATQHAPLIRIWTRAQVFPPVRLLRFRRAAGQNSLWSRHAAARQRHLYLLNRKEAPQFSKVNATRLNWRALVALQFSSPSRLNEKQSCLASVFRVNKEKKKCSRFNFFFPINICVGARFTREQQWRLSRSERNITPPMPIYKTLRVCK